MIPPLRGYTYPGTEIIHPDKHFMGTDGYGCIRIGTEKISGTGSGRKKEANTGKNEGVYIKYVT